MGAVAQQTWWFHLPRTQWGTMVPQTRICFALRHQTQLASTRRPCRIWKRTSPGDATHSPRREVAARGGIPTHSMQQLSSISSEIQHHQHQGPAKSLSGSRLVDTWMISTARDMSEWREKVTTSIQVHNCFAMYVACHVPVAVHCAMIPSLYTYTLIHVHKVHVHLCFNKFQSFEF